MDRKLQDKMNIALTREERVLLWDLVGREIDKLKWEKCIAEGYVNDKINRLKVLEILIIG
jgi:hypothetical protein